MTKQEAIKVMEDGKKITHRSFADGQYLFILEGDTFTEKYYNVGKPTDEFWKGHSYFEWADGWVVFEENEIKKPNCVLKGTLISLPNKKVKKVEDLFSKKQTILNFLKQGGLTNINQEWKDFKKENPDFCSQVYFYKTYKKQIQIC